MLLFSYCFSGKDKDEKKEEGSEVSTEEGEESVEEEKEEKKFYDKSKSFFDNITCETNNPRGLVVIKILIYLFRYFLDKLRQN